LFPLSINGSVTVQSCNATVEADLVNAISADLTLQQIEHDVVGSDVVFKNGSFAVWSFARYFGVVRGRFAVRSGRVEYSLSTRFLFFMATALSMFMALLTWKFTIFAYCWAVLFGANYALIWFRNRLFLRKLSRQARML
jgi:hypothetical protein